jgi:NADH dehydrogenase FAD-containing subunit
VPILASAGQAPAWLQTSALALDDSGFIAVDALQRSSSHAQVFAAGDVSSRADCTQPHNGFHATQTGAALVRNVRAQLAGIAPTPYTPLEQKLLLLACGKRSAIASWGEHSAQGFWVWWLKKWLDQRAIKDLRSR